MKKKDSIISDLTDFFDHHLLSTGKKELALKTANELIKGEEKFQGVYLKLLLEEGKILQAYQTEISPRQWYIKFSQPDKYRELRKEYLLLNSPSINETAIKKNNLRNDLEVVVSSFNKLKGKGNFKWVIWIVIILMLVVLFWATNKKPYEPSKYYTKGGYYYAVSEEAFDKMREYTKAKNNAALSALIQDGEIITLPDGSEVSIVNMYAPSLNGYGGWGVIRPKGGTYKLWTEWEAIDYR